ncbi:hypothetical protein NLJ89_g9707 [Agrocybe chaxingu]|uniref:HAT C-terminal dimerisation domain-containing protein n=1 Tax=Agrocybe chaxingu TaxID=84603 RepID=A0A9W8JVE2_9AGAR|nr:hypothetical protein NLJ89_g9707 [Agrocybe chaxingu]
MNICLEAQGLLPEEGGCKQRDADHTRITYSHAGHRALIALRCAKFCRPFNMVSDDDYHLEVAMLHPNTVPPSPSTISRDVKAIYLELGRHVLTYFKDRNAPIHLVLDGWTSPLIASYLGLVVVWYQDGSIHRAILEFIRLTQRHDGQYLADVVASCLNHYSLSDMIFISFFFKKPKAKKNAPVASRAAQQRFQHQGAVDSDESEDEAVIEEEGDGDEGSDDDGIDQAEADALIKVAEDDEGQGMHNERIVKTLREKAIILMEKKGIYLDPDEERIALQIFPRVAGLARRVHDASNLKERFDQMVKDDPALEGSQRSLTRRVPTRWNSDLDCLDSHFYFKDVVERLTAIASLKLSAYRLSEAQWKMAKDVVEVLLLFKTVTKVFSKAEVPLVVDVLPTLEEIREGLIAARDDDINDVSTVIQVACQAGLLLVDKYSTFAEDCEIYVIALVMCLDRKLKWFKDHGHTTRQIKEIEKMVIVRWNKSYAPEDASQEDDDSVEMQARTCSRYAPPVAQTRFPPDHISTYLRDPLLPMATIKEAGGYVHYWHQASKGRPRLARMGSDFCSAPATSVDAEQAFSTGRRQVNFMQHNMNSQTFKAQMAVRSWARSPLYPGFEYVQKVIEKEIDSEENPFVNRSTD